jgi:hypothetical protein
VKAAGPNANGAQSNGAQTQKPAAPGSPTARTQGNTAQPQGQSATGAQSKQQNQNMAGTKAKKPPLSVDTKIPPAIVLPLESYDPNLDFRNIPTYSPKGSQKVSTFEK